MINHILVSHLKVMISLMQYRVVVGAHTMYVRRKESPNVLKGKFWLFYLEVSICQR